MTGENPIREVIYSNPPPNKSLGYSKSKWVAEAICLKAAKFSWMAGRIKVLRIGQLTGDTKNGVWNRSEAWPLMLSTTKQLGCLPMLDEKLSWLPVDVAARAVIEISLLSQRTGTSSPCTVYHLVSNNQDTSWMDLLGWINEDSREEILLVEPNKWLEKLERMDHHPAQSLLGLWKNGFGKVGEDAATGENKGLITFDTGNASSSSQAMRSVGPIDEVVVRKMWQWLNEAEDGSLT